MDMGIDRHGFCPLRRDIVLSRHQAVNTLGLVRMEFSEADIHLRLIKSINSGIMVVVGITELSRS